MATTINCRELFLRLGDDEVVVVDCREAQDWERLQFLIPGALRMSPQELREAADILPDDELIVLCGVADDGSDARKASRQLQVRGIPSVILEGGLREWLSYGFPIERFQPAEQPYTAHSAHA